MISDVDCCMFVRMYVESYCHHRHHHSLAFLRCATIRSIRSVFVIQLSLFVG